MVILYCCVRSAAAAAGSLEHVVPVESMLFLWLENCQCQNFVKLLQNKFWYELTVFRLAQ